MVFEFDDTCPKYKLPSKGRQSLVRGQGLLGQGSLSREIESAESTLTVPLKIGAAVYFLVRTEELPVK